MNPNPYIPRPWQLPHMLATPVGGKVLIVERCKPQPENSWNHLDGVSFCRGQHQRSEGCTYDVTMEPPLGPLGTVLACKEPVYWNVEHDNFYFATDKKGVGNDRYRSLKKRFAELVNKSDKTPVSANRLPIELCRLFYCTTAIDLRRVDTMTEEEALAWGCPVQQYAPIWNEQLTCSIPTPMNMHPLVQAHFNFESDNPGATWGDWAWFITAERVERCD